MPPTELSHEEARLIQELRQKYHLGEGEMLSYLRGLRHFKGVFYWEYIHLDTLLSIQHTRTDFDDELIFIVYHQITELYFRLVISELDKLTCHSRKEYLDQASWQKRLGRVINYFNKLIYSFDVLDPGDGQAVSNHFDAEEFNHFRMSLQPASGFQTVQLRKIELMSTSLGNLVRGSQKGVADTGQEPEDLYESIYWKAGGRLMDPEITDFKKLQKTRSLETFEKQYDQELFHTVREFSGRNLYYLYFHLKPSDHEEDRRLAAVREDGAVRKMLTEYDHKVNIEWKTRHLETIRKHMGHVATGTGGTNWSQYLPPEMQNISYFPELKNTI